MTVSLNNQLALVTGAGRGIGRAICLALAEAGATVVLVARTKVEIDLVAAEIAANGGQARAVQADVAEEDQVINLFATVRQSLGLPNIIVNNAGVGRFGPLVDFSISDFDQVMATNLRGTFLCCREALRAMRERGSGSIINIASVVGIKGYPKQAAYTASKHGIVGLTKSLAEEAREFGVRASVVLPGGVDTAMVGDARPDLDRDALLQPEDVAETVLYLLQLPERAAVDQIYLRRRGSASF
ncbi:MAG: SDR family NAD(P)-dependent oxidoreductase [Verrucomicrobia bacterium]|nr:SDR family NAD(P)-dependent oxidoreductase [Verrucomicrobiota bacterium]